MFRSLRLVVKVAIYNFYCWKGNTRIIVTFILAFIVCFLLTDKTVDFAVEHETTMQLLEAFILTFGDSNSILLISLLLLILFSDMPFITTATPFFLCRGNRKVWVLGQLLYICMATSIFMLFVLGSTCVLSVHMSYTKNIWSRTIAILAYSNEGDRLALPVAVKTLEMSRPYETMFSILGLMLLYTLVMVFVMLFFNVWKGPVAGTVSVLIYSVFGLLLNPDNIQKLFRLPDVLYYKARVWVGWLSPLNHATYSMHNFGYDNLPTLGETVMVFGSIFCVLIILSVQVMRRYSFQFKGTER